MATPKHELDVIYEMLDSENLDFQKDAISFWVADCIVKYRDPKLINVMPNWVGEMVREMCDTYRRNGRYCIYSSLGEKDHSPMISDLIGLLERS